MIRNNFVLNISITSHSYNILTERSQLPVHMYKILKAPKISTTYWYASLGHFQRPQVHQTQTLGNWTMRDFHFLHWPTHNVRVGLETSFTDTGTKNKTVTHCIDFIFCSILFFLCPVKTESENNTNFLVTVDSSFLKHHQTKRDCTSTTTKRDCTSTTSCKSLKCFFWGQQCPGICTFYHLIEMFYWKLPTSTTVRTEYKRQISVRPHVGSQMFSYCISCN